MQRRWWRRALEQRLGTLAAAALLLWTVGTAIAASVTTDRIARAMVAERRSRAQSIASRIDQALEDELRQLDRVAAASVAARESLPSHVRAMRLAESVLRIAPGGDVLWARSVADGRETAPVLPQLPSRFSSRHVDATGVMTTGAGPRVFLVLPARETDPIGGSVAAAIDSRNSPLVSVLASYAGEPYRVELRDARGLDIAASRLAGGARRVANDRELLIAHAPVSNGAWELRLVEPRAEALAPVLTLRRILVGSSLLLLPFAVLAALATARSILQPVLAMTGAAERLARGEYGTPVPAAGEDEIGRLAEALDQLRRTLEADERRNMLLKRVISAQEEERRRIARELHDQTTQQLSALAMLLESVSSAHPGTRELLGRSRRLVGAMIDDLHRIIYDLRPSMLDDLGLLPAIRTYAETRLATHGIDVHCEFPSSIPRLPHDATTALYRVVQEALTNVVRHARAETVFIGCTLTDDGIVLEVEDDGVGFDPAAVARPRETGEGLGVLGMRERLALFGGRLEIESEPQRGTRLVAYLPTGQGSTGPGETPEPAPGQSPSAGPIEGSGDSAGRSRAGGGGAPRHR
jgi:signal transduction histidine kinase